MDNRRSYYLTLDTETANGLDSPFMYDIGGAIHDKDGNIYESFSYVISEVFYGLRDMMQTAYYADKLPKYEEEIAMGSREVVSIWEARRTIKELCEKYSVKAIIAYNARFDYSSTNGTLRYLTKSKYRWFLPYGIPVWDSWKMAQDTICKQKAYAPFCKKNGFVCANGRIKTSAEVVYRYMTQDTDFIESHTGFEDVKIEVAIFSRCMAQHKKMRKNLW